jgi:hypothetical protein
MAWWLSPPDNRLAWRSLKWPTLDPKHIQHQVDNRLDSLLLRELANAKEINEWKNAIGAMERFVNRRRCHTAVALVGAVWRRKKNRLHWVPPGTMYVGSGTFLVSSQQVQRAELRPRLSQARSPP